MPRRVDRVNELLRHEISRLLILQAKDPRLQGVISVMRVVTSPDLREAQVFISVMGDAATKQRALDGIRSAAAFLQRELRPRLTLRYTPFLTFALDESLEEGNHVLDLMDRIRDSGAQGTGPYDDDSYVGPLTLPSNKG